MEKKTYDYSDAVKVKTQEEADVILAALVNQCMENTDKTREEVEEIQRSNIGYVAGYYDEATRERAEKLYGAVHPIFGPVSNVITPDQAFQMGREFAASTKGKQ